MKGGKNMEIQLPSNWDDMEWSEQYDYAREHGKEYP